MLYWLFPTREVSLNKRFCNKVTHHACQAAGRFGNWGSVINHPSINLTNVRKTQNYKRSLSTETGGLDDKYLTSDISTIIKSTIAIQENDHPPSSLQRKISGFKGFKASVYWSSLGLSSWQHQTNNKMHKWFQSQRERERIMTTVSSYCTSDAHTYTRKLLSLAQPFAYFYIPI